MDFGQVVKLILALATAAVGAAAIVNPRGAGGFTGFGRELSPRGMSEMRSVMGGFFLAAGLVPVLLNRNVLYISLGLGYLTIAAVRTLSIFVLDKDKSPSNIVSLIWEVIFGVLLVVLPTSTIPA